MTHVQNHEHLRMVQLNSVEIIIIIINHNNKQTNKWINDTCLKSWTLTHCAVNSVEIILIINNNNKQTNKQTNKRQTFKIMKTYAWHSWRVWRDLCSWWACTLPGVPHVAPQSFRSALSVPTVASSRPQTNRFVSFSRLHLSAVDLCCNILNKEGKKCFI